MRSNKYLLIALLFTSLKLCAQTNINLGIGYTDFFSAKDNILVFSPYIYDQLINKKQQLHASVTLSAKRPFNVFSKELLIGPALYFQQARFSADVWELGSPEFFNYQARYGINSWSGLLEADWHFLPSVKIDPFVTAGLGFNVVSAFYNDYATANIAYITEKHWQTNITKPTFELAAGVQYPLSERWSLLFKYAYFYVNNANLNANLELNPSQQSGFIAINYIL